MKLRNLNYETWVKNHPKDHNAAWFRKFYPFELIASVDFGDDMLGVEQSIRRGKLEYSAVLKSLTLQENGRYKCILAFRDRFNSDTKRWNNRTWQSDFEVIFTPDRSFITIYTRDTDPTKQAVRSFYSGDFKSLGELKSMPLSNILIQSMIINISERYFPNGRQDEPYAWLPEGIIPALDHPGLARKRCNFFAPIYSQQRDLWVCYAFEEEKAHRIAIYNGDQCRRLFVVFVNPTPTSHHRCRYKHASVLSFHEFSSLCPAKVSNWAGQIRFLQNHMNPPENRLRIKELKQEIEKKQNESYPIQKSHLMEALSIMNLRPITVDEMFFYLCAMNLVNAWINRQLKQKEQIQDKKLRSLYSFKNRLADVLEHQLRTESLLARMFIDRNLVMLELHGYQFSFHEVKLGEELKKYRDSQRNEQIEWRGKRMQPIASLVYELGKLKCPKGLTRMDEEAEEGCNR